MSLVTWASGRPVRCSWNLVSRPAAILPSMRSIADDLRTESRRDIARRSPTERIELAFRLGEDDVAILCAAQRVLPEEAKRLIARSRGAGRIPSAVAGGRDG